MNITASFLCILRVNFSGSRLLLRLSLFDCISSLRLLRPDCLFLSLLTILLLIVSSDCGSDYQPNMDAAFVSSCTSPTLFGTS